MNTSSAPISTPPAITPRRRRYALGVPEKVVIGLHIAVAFVAGVIGFFDVDEGWADLQRILIFMVVSAWVGGVALVGYLVRLIPQTWVRVTVLLGGPFLAIAALTLAARF